MDEKMHLKCAIYTFVNFTASTSMAWTCEKQLNTRQRTCRALERVFNAHNVKQGNEKNT